MVIQGGMKRLQGYKKGHILMVTWSHLALQKRCILLQPLRTLCNFFIFVTIGEILQNSTSKNLLAVYFFIQLSNYIKFWFVPLA